MTIHMDPLYKQHMEQDEYGELCHAMVEFGLAATRYDKCLSDREKASLLWDTGTNSNGAKVDVLSLEFEFPDHSPSKMKFPILAIRGFTALDLFLYYLKALDYPRLPVKEMQS